MSFHEKTLKFCDFDERVFTIELAIKYATDTTRSASCLDLHLEINKLRTKTLRKKRLFQFSY